MFEISADYGVDYRYIKLFMDSVSGVDIVTFSLVEAKLSYTHTVPIVKVWVGGKFMGVIMSATNAIIINKI